MRTQVGDILVGVSAGSAHADENLEVVAEFDGVGDRHGLFRAGQQGTS
jgi:hypothetical protein